MIISRTILLSLSWHLTNCCFAEYTWPIKEEKIPVWTDANYLAYVLSGKEVWLVDDVPTSSGKGMRFLLVAYFTAPSLIGFIALAGVMVRNSVLLIDFINIRMGEGAPLKQAIIEAGAVRITPILLTAGAVALGAVIILFDPIFQGLAISLMGGTLTSTFLTLLVVPLIYFRIMRGKHEK